MARHAVQVTLDGRSEVDGDLLAVAQSPPSRPLAAVRGRPHLPVGVLSRYRLTLPVRVFFNEPHDQRLRLFE